MDKDVAAPANGEAAPLNNVEAPAAAPAQKPEGEPAAPAITAEQVAQFLGTTPDTLKDYQTYMDNNGGFDKAFANTKKVLSGRNAGADAANQTQMQMQAQTPPATTEAPAQPAPQPKVEGGFTAQEFMVQQYFQNLSQQDRYASIKDEISNGEVLKVMQQFNIQPMIGDQFNNQQVTAFLDMYAKTKPAPAAQAPVTSTPTAEFTQIAGETITSMDQAMIVLKEDQAARAAGLAGHPLAKQANEFFDNALNAHQNRGKREHKALEPK